jgi:CBS domain-containing protein
MNASDVMTRTILSVRPDAVIAEAIRLMLDNRISGLPVIDEGGQLVGILTEGDLLRRGETATERHRPRWLEILMGPGRLAEEYVRTHGRRIAEVMTRDPVSVTPDTPLKEIVELMERHRIKRVPVLDGDAPVGILSRADLLRGLAGALAAAPAVATSDEEIRERILAELARAAWVPRDGIAITVENGVVDLNGVILEEKERDALRVAAENVPGVTAVEDHLVWVEPVSGTVIDPPPAAAKPRAGPARPPR